MSEKIGAFRRSFAYRGLFSVILGGHHVPPSMDSKLQRTCLKEIPFDMFLRYVEGSVRKYVQQLECRRTCSQCHLQSLP